MLKYANILILLSPSWVLAHASNDLSHGHSHYFFSWHHFLGLVFLAIVGAGAIWYFTRRKSSQVQSRVKVRKD